MTNMQVIPTKLYSTQSVARIDRDAIDKYNIPGYTLMRRAGQAVFNFIEKKFSTPMTLLIICGSGNNAGDGYVVARIADQHGWKVKVVSLIDTAKLKGDAKQACLHWCERGDVLEPDIKILDETVIVIDAILGTGIKRDVSEQWQEWINRISDSQNPIISLDVPSGLNANTGVVMGSAIRADTTVTFIGLKKGLFTASGKSCCGEIIFDDLSVPEVVIQNVSHDATLLNGNTCRNLNARQHDTHKGHNGHVVIIGGNAGMPGAVILAARAALKTGAGLVSVVTKEEHVASIVSACPEAMVFASKNGNLPESLINKATCIVIGPGLGQDSWANRLYYQSIKTGIPLVIDADALNTLSENQETLHSPTIITPHPGEAARLLSISVQDIQNDRFKAAKDLYELTGAVVVLKGSGTIVFDGEITYVCPYGNPAMAVAGMGDALTGVIAACYAQGLNLNEAAATGVFYHSLAGDLAAGDHTRGLLTSDLIEKIPQVVN